MGLRARLVTGAVIAMVLFFAVVLIAARVTVVGDLREQAQTRVAAGADAFTVALQSRIDQTRNVAAQIAEQPDVQKAVVSHDTAALHTILQGAKHPNNCSFAAVVDARGNALARATGVDGGVEPSKLPALAMNDTVVAGVEIVDQPLLHAELLIMDAAPFTRAPSISAAAPVVVDGKVIATIFVGTLLLDTTQLVDNVGKFSGGGAALALGNTIVASSIENSDGSRAINIPLSDTVDGTPYLTTTQPIVDYAGNRVASLWIGIPQASLFAVADHAMWAMTLWALLALAIAVAFTILAADRLGNAIGKRSREVTDSARELAILVVGTEVSEEHACLTTARLEALAQSLPRIDDPEELSKAIDRTHDDVVVLNVLTGELAERMRDARARVAQLGTVARGLDAIVAGARPSAN
jgi:hypothetical protein